MKTIGIIGCGNMGGAIVKNLKDKLKGKKLLISDKDVRKRALAKKKYRISVLGDNRELARKSDVIILAVKPKEAKAILAEIKDTLKSSKLVISIMAGVSRGFIKKCISGNSPVIRVMPNMPSLIGQGVSAICSDGASGKHRNTVKRIFSSLGEVVFVKENDFDAVTAISGSGPAYFFYLVEIMIKTAVSMGLKRKAAERLAIKTAQGSAELLGCLKEDPKALRKKVTSKGGTTEAAFKEFRKRNLEKALLSGIKKAKNRARQLSGG